MWRKVIEDHGSGRIENKIQDFRALFCYINHLAKHKLGYPVSLLTYLGVVDNQVLGIKPDSLANVLLNNVGDPFKDSETSLMEVKVHERKLISILEKYYGLNEDEARGYVTTGGTEGNFAGLWWSKRYLINRSLDKLIKTDDIIKLQTKEEQELMTALAKISTNAYQERMLHLQKIIDVRNAITENKNIVQQLLTPTVFYTQGHTHYSVPKIAEILRLNIRSVTPEDDGSMNLNILKREILLHLSAHPHSSIIVIANIGTTITGAIDYVPGIKKILDEIQSKVNYTIHMDGALSGFVLPVLKPFGEVKNYFDELGVNTLAVSAHKYPGLSQPCGIVLARKEFFDKAFEKGERNIDYVGNILDVTITGSRSGLNVLMFYNALCTFKLDKTTDILKDMVNENIKMAKYLQQELIKLYGGEQVLYPYHFNVIFPKPSKELAKKYQLMITGDRATICVLTNVKKELVDQFIKDLKAEKEKAMTANTTNLELTIDTLKESHAKSAVNLFVKSFCDSEPITKHLNIRYADYQPFAEEVINKAVKDGMSKVALDKNGRVVACVIAEDMADPFVPKLSHYPKLRPVFALLDELSKPFLRKKTFIKGKIAHVWIAVVDPNYRGQGLSTMVDTACGDMEARKGYDFVYAEFTNPLSEKIVNQYNLYQLCNKVNYNTFTYEGDKPFSGLEGEAASYIIVIRPGVRLDSLDRCYKVAEKY